MMFWVGTTDPRWFEFLAPRQLDEVNFWQPSVRPAFESAPTGMPFVFKLKRPYNHGEIFGQKNGAASVAELRELLGSPDSRGNPLTQIICQVIANPVFFKARDWLPDPPGWSSGIVPYAQEGAHDVRNGLLLRADFHRLFDAGLVSITPDMTIRISPRIRDAWFNGKAYYRMDGQPLTEAELADVGMLLAYLCHDLGVDLAVAVSQKIDANELRYPVEKSRGRSEKCTRL